MSSTDHTSTSEYPLPPEAGDPETFKRRIQGESAKSVLEIGRTPAVYSYAILEALQANGYGVLSSLEAITAPKNKKFYRLLTENGFENSHSVIKYKKSYHWALQRMISDPSRSYFDMCLISANKRFESSALTATLADILIRPGGLLVMPGSNWSMQTSPYFKERPEIANDVDNDEIESRPLEVVRDTILFRLGYEIISEPNCPDVIFARKPT
ncbi:hypothetical protein [Cognatishimia activa]|uniref:Uncharacterized protein n=1 Tax=Cognatishimia activa TaxID=1715691 RepID=A0A0P1IVJ4_9RHOB|nr:hypothetical protein [Cognatishimia activa]CUJ18058.1 hypothetical protein TA5113_02552 [Cognatishimia activa]CUK27585.1 hypothetical protein TA5114_03413 [Cognatishimia activa]